MSVGGAISASNLALTDATSTRENRQQNTMQRVCFTLWASRNRCRTWKISALWIAGHVMSSDKNSYSDLQPKAAVEHNE